MKKNQSETDAKVDCYTQKGYEDMKVILMVISIK